MSTTAIRHRPCPNAERTASLFNRIKATFSDGRNAREFRSDRFPHSRLVIADSKSGLTVTLSQPFLPYSDGRTEQMILPLSSPLCPPGCPVFSISRQIREMRPAIAATEFSGRMRCSKQAPSAFQKSASINPLPIPLRHTKGL